MTRTLALEYKEGDRIAGRYLVHRALAGGMGEVYLCTDQQTQARYALKTFQAPHLARAGLREAFEAEAAVWVALESHVNLVRCFFMDTLAGRPYMFLEWVDAGDSRGTDLRSLMHGSALEPRQVLELTLDICHGLKHAQDRRPGLVHRDLKPENVLIAPGMKMFAVATSQGIEPMTDVGAPPLLAKITDFGLATIASAAGLEVSSNLDSTHQSMHAGGGIAGTPRYMAPEQWRGEEADARTDIYAIGVMLYEMLSGRPPYEGTTFEALRRQHLKDLVPAIARAGLSASFDQLVSRCMAKEMAARFSSVTELLHELKEIYTGRFSDYKPADIVMRGLFMPEDMVNRAKAYLELGRIDDARADYDQAINAYPDFALAYVGRGTTWLQSGDPARALEDLNRAIELDSSLASAYSNRGNVYSMLNQHQDSLADYTRAIELDPAFATAWVNRGALLRWLGDDERAQSDLDRAIELDPSIGVPYRERGRIHLRRGRLQEALADFSQAIELLPEEAESYVARSHILSQMGRGEEALEDCDAAIRIDPLDAQAHYNRGVIQQRRGRFIDALADFTRALEIEPDRADALTNRGVVLDAVGRSEEGLVDLTRALALDPSSALAYMNRGVVNDRLDRDEESIADFNRAVELSPTFAEAYKNRAHRHARAGRADKAFADFARAIDLNLGFGTAYLARGQLLASLKRHDEAIEDYTRAIKLDSTDAVALDFRGRSHDALAHHGEAVEDYTRALAWSAEKATLLTSRGVARLKAGELQAALEDFQAAIEADPQEAAPYVLAAELLASNNQAAAAIPFYVHALRLEQAPWASMSAKALARLGVESSA